ncbi:MAG: proprotein convertase P-domain-containing protein, partial [Anaerolineae bacterium]|nr:proprotein convertase P-domain-containing protein [Anaerolineae bacterium]
MSPVSTPKRFSLPTILLIAALALAASAVASLSAEGPEPLAYCYGENMTGGALSFDTPLAQIVTLACAPAGASATDVKVVVNLDHDCSGDLEIRLENGVHAKLLQPHNCQIGPGAPMVLTFTEPTFFDGDPVNDDWKLTITDRCRECPGYLASWSIQVDYEEAPPSRTPTATATRRATPTPTPTRPDDSVTFPGGDWPWYAQGEISVHPYPPLAGEPVELCVELLNPTAATQTVQVQFSWADFGIGIPFTPINGLRTVTLPPMSTVKECLMWVPPVSGHVCIQVELFVPGRPPQRSQRNIDVDEPLRPGEPHEKVFPVGNPTNELATIDLKLVPHVPRSWSIGLLPETLAQMEPGEVRDVTLTVVPPQGEPLPPDGTLIVDVEAYIGERLIGGFRKVFRPPIPIHPFRDPPYAEREITVDPYPPLAGEPTELCVELRNPTAHPHDVTVQFSWANFGIGLPFTPINGPRNVHLPPHSVVKECIMWIPPTSGHVCIQVELFAEGYEPQRSQRNIDVDEPLQPGEPHTRVFPVGNPTDQMATVTLGLVPHAPGWGLELSQDVLPDMAP